MAKTKKNEMNDGGALCRLFFFLRLIHYITFDGRDGYVSKIWREK